MAKNDNTAMDDLPGFNDPVDDSNEDFFLDFTDVEAADGFPVLPRGWYKVRVTDDNPREIKNAGGKLPQGTPGTSFTLTVIEGEYEGNKLFTNFWHHQTSLPYLKNFMAKSGAFTEDELSSRMSLDTILEKLEGAEMWADVRIKEYQGNPQNDVRGFKHLSERETGSVSNSSILPS